MPFMGYSILPMDPVIGRSFKHVIHKTIRDGLSNPVKTKDAGDLKLLRDLVVDIHNDFYRSPHLELKEKELKSLHIRLNALGKNMAKETPIDADILDVQHIHQKIAEAMVREEYIEKVESPKWLKVQPTTIGYMANMRKREYEYLTLQLNHVLDDADMMDYIHLSRKDENVLRNIRRRISTLLGESRLHFADDNETFDIKLSLDERRVLWTTHSTLKDIGYKQHETFPHLDVRSMTDNISSRLHGSGLKPIHTSR